MSKRLTGPSRCALHVMKPSHNDFKAAFGFLENLSKSNQILVFVLLFGGEKVVRLIKHQEESARGFPRKKRLNIGHHGVGLRRFLADVNTCYAKLAS